jgi:hypothetical protein
MPPKRRGRPARDRTALGNFKNYSSAPSFNPGPGDPQEAGLEQTVEHYADTDIDLLRATGSDKIPPAPLCLIAGGEP